MVSNKSLGMSTAMSKGIVMTIEAWKLKPPNMQSEAKRRTNSHHNYLMILILRFRRLLVKTDKE